MKRNQTLCALLILLALLLATGGHALAQNTATLSGVVKDQQGGSIRGAKVTLTSKSTGAERTSVSNEEGRYSFVALAPGTYKISVDGGASFSVFEQEGLTVTVGQEAEFDPQLMVRGVATTTTVTAETTLIEENKTEVSNTVDQRRIDNLPINGRDYKNFTLIDSRTTRDVSPTIGPAPNSGLNIGGARARSNMVSVDGADAVDNSVNGIRATVSQEAVQEFQMVLSNYNAEYGRATGGVINIVTKSGGNEFHGDAFVYGRNKSFQARNPFSGQIDPASGDLVPVKQPYTRIQTGLTLGGPIKKDKTFFFGSYEYTQREETGFSSIGINNFGMAPFNCGGCGLDGLVLTPDQSAAVLQLLGGNAQQQQLAQQYAVFMGSASSVALNRLDFGLVSAGLTGGFLNPGPGAQFPIPVACPVGETMNDSANTGTPPACSAAGVYVAPLPASYVGLNSIRGNYPVEEKTSLWSAKLDQNWTANNHSFIRVGVSPSLVTGLPSTSQNQVFGQNSGSRAGYNQSRDLNVTFQHDTITSDSAVNQFRFQFARRGLHFGFSQLPGGGDIGVNIPGFAYFGREPYSTVDRIERRFEFTDTIAKTFGRHTFKFGADYNLIQLRSAKAQIFELDFGGVANFGGISASSFNGNFAGLPGATGLQAYGLGIPTTYIQGIGNSNQPFDNFPIGLFAQDSWRINRKLTLNYGVRYDVEITPLFAPATAVNAAAEKALGVVEGIPRDYNNFAPRVGLAWDPTGSGKTSIRLGYGLFYDHPLLAIAFNSVTADGGRSVQLLSAGGTPSACGLLPGTDCTASGSAGADTPANLNGSSIFQGVLNTGSTDAVFSPLSLAYLPNQQRFDPLAANSLFANQNYLNAGFPLPILPFTLPVAANFKFGYAQQGNLTIERALSNSWKVSVSYQYTRGIHLNRPVNVNSTDPVLLDQNALNAVAAGLRVTNPVTVAVPAASLSNAGFCTLNVIQPSVLGILSNCPAGPFAGLNGSYVGTPAVFNFFRPSGPNPSFGGPGAANYAGLLQLAGLAGYPTGFGAPVPFNSVDAQLSDASSWYHALTLNVQKRFSKGFELLSSYTYSHSIDNGTDLQSTLEPQDSRFPNLEKANSVNDQRHRWVTSAVFTTGTSKNGDSAWRHFITGFTFAPLIEVSSGRPFNVITGEDTRLDLGASEARPSVASSGGTTSPFIPGVQFAVADVCLTNSGTPFNVPLFTPPAGCIGSLGRNAFTGPDFFQIDMRLSKRIPLGERLSIDLIADGFNMLNRTNIAAVNQLCDPSAGATCLAGQPTAAYDARQFQFALKLRW
jgi:Carboxypeptidase regulatory-like domain/TonB dependent receptor-like, beta-barrel